LAGAAATAMMAAIGAPEIVSADGAHRSIALYNIHTKETASVVFKKDGKYVEAGLEKVNHILRDFRRNETTKMDPELIDLMWEMHSELGSREPIHIISGYRSRATNEQLRRTVGGQASESRHIYGKAADVHFPDVPVKKLRYSALVREKGGVGYYPTSAIPFVHIDTDRVRHWPRLPRHELALLFPGGATRHAPADGGPITREDVRVAQARYRDLAVQVAEFHEERRGGPRPPVALVADAGAARPGSERQPAPPSANPQLAALVPTPALPKPIAITAPSDHERARLTELALRASAGPQLLSSPRLLSGPVPARRPAPALPSLTGDPLPGPGLARPAVPKAAPRVAAVDPAALAGPDRLNDAGRYGWSGNWAPAPAYDEEHPEELSYRPFPITPYLTDSASQPLMAELVHHDVARTLDVLDQPGSGMPLRFRPGEQTARLLWAQHFTGEAIGLSKLFEAQAPSPGALQSRTVKTSAR
jgi:uncharacterized protein YcbK (DUF882 family)